MYVGASSRAVSLVRAAASSLRSKPTTRSNGPVICNANCSHLIKPRHPYSTFWTMSRSMSSAKVPNSDVEDTYVVDHNIQNHQFFIKLATGEATSSQAVIDYAWLKEGVADLYHTEVPPALRGKGIAKVLAKVALDYFVAEDVKMNLSCSYLAKYVRDNPLPEYTSRLN